MTRANKIMIIFFILISFSLGIENTILIFLSDYHNVGLSLFVATCSFLLCGVMNDELLIHEESSEYE
jgi:hypothetical protein